eukprot:TRINITY_DN1814_c0_g1_i4.p5 TRINITY_DN1814_c0_g1~~TRINITY_DN1814_c0_g1_i4.p5  ORF type:complete len:109 (+),score=0.59 TRINITY_DN1814_c0_g1_i4:83-409(+)
MVMLIRTMLIIRRAVIQELVQNLYWHMGPGCATTTSSWGKEGGGIAALSKQAGALGRTSPQHTPSYVQGPRALVTWARHGDSFIICTFGGPPQTPPSCVLQGVAACFN